MPSPASRVLGSSSATASVAGDSARPDEVARGVRAAIPRAMSWGESNGVPAALASAALRIECGPEGFARARAFTRATLCRWSLDHCGDDAVVVVTELAANAATHAVPCAAALAASDTDVWLALTLDTAHVTLAVTDPCDSPPAPAPAAGPHLAESGRGLGIVEALADVWGWSPRPPAGKTVWARLSTRPPR
ncbi:ATP-binding protein [Streptomyces sp. NPDC046197]|uniref:ATP-binding protein n=1 Tax=Streptomyces sp. NPDC046197 TaxID=3154337 RepID=UPI0033D87330